MNRGLTRQLEKVVNSTKYFNDILQTSLYIIYVFCMYVHKRFLHCLCVILVIQIHIDYFIGLGDV